MRRAALGTAAFFLAAPCVVAGVIPWLLTGWDARDHPAVLTVAGALLVAAATAVLLDAFARFAVEGVGTPAHAAYRAAVPAWRVRLRPWTPPDG